MEQKFRFHVLGIPHTRTNKDYTACAYTQKAYKFCKMMHDRGHYVIHYGVEGSNPECDENVVVVSNEVYNRVYGDYDYHHNMFKYNTNDECYLTFYANAIAEIRKRMQPNDFILPFWGAGTRPICDAIPELITVEPGIGYGNGSWAPYRVYESYAIMHAHQGIAAIEKCSQSNYHVVIPNYFDLDDFSYDITAERLEHPYFAFVGRVYNGKGVNIAIQVSQILGVPLKIAGQLGDEYKDYKWPEGIEYVGYVNAEQRNALMKGAAAVFVPSQYLEPFGGVQIEALLSGTPTITSDWGAFAENNIHGETGYRCRTFDDYLNAAMDCLDHKILYSTCRNQGENFSLENIAPKYEKFFGDVLNLYTGDGWYKLSDHTKERLQTLNT